MDNKIVNGVWRGSALTNIQKLCIRSYQYHGHEFHLYTDQPVEGVPEGIIIHDALEVTPKPFENPTTNALRMIGANYYSDYFRVCLIEQIGGWYVDLDTVCLRHFDFPDDYAFVSESKLSAMKGHEEQIEPPSNQVQEYLSGCIFKAPAHAPFLKWIINEIEHYDVKRTKNWICLGPEMFQKAIPKFGLQQYVKPPSVFDALNYNEYILFVTGMSGDWTFPPEALAIHLRTSFWQEKYHPILKPNGVFPESSLYEKLKLKYGVKNA